MPKSSRLTAGIVVSLIALLCAAVSAYAGTVPILWPLQGGGAVYCGAPWRNDAWSSSCVYPLAEAMHRSVVFGVIALIVLLIGLALIVSSRTEVAERYPRDGPSPSP